MAKKLRKSAPRKKKPETLRAFRIELGKDKTTVKDIELAIKNKLATQPTDLLRKASTVVIVVESEDEGP